MVDVQLHGTQPVSVKPHKEKGTYRVLVLEKQTVIRKVGLRWRADVTPEEQQRSSE